MNLQVVHLGLGDRTMALSDFGGCSIVQCLMRALMVVELEVPVHAVIDIIRRVVVVGVHLLIFNRSPQAVVVQIWVL